MKFCKSIEWGGRHLTLETGEIARQASGSVVVHFGDTVVLCTVVGEQTLKDTLDFFPLSVHYQEKSFSAGRIPGGFIKREGKPSEKEVLAARLIDRPLRPLFDSSLRNEVQVICTVLSFDSESDAEIAAIIGASAAVSLSGLPFKGPMAACRVGYDQKDFILNPTIDQIEDGFLDLVVAGTREGILMVESRAFELCEDTMLKALRFAHESYQPVLDLIDSLKSLVMPGSFPNPQEVDPVLFQTLCESVGDDLKVAYAHQAKQERYAALDTVFDKARCLFSQEVVSDALLKELFDKLKASYLRGVVLNEGRRVDGRGLKDIRPISSRVGFLKRVHGSALFTRGETQALVATTLGSPSDEQMVDDLAGEYKERFMLHYNFPPYSVGETGRMSSPGRREIGHGRLAWRSISPLMPEVDEFPYAVRVVSEVTESNGSSSMATVCGTSLSLMDAGVPLREPVAGIAMGLIKEQGAFAILSDILGDEDHLGDMDFKVAGTSQGITALQMDLKIDQVNFDIMEKALEQAREGRFHILGEMNKTLSASRVDLSPYAPRIIKVMIEKDKIRDLIGPGGRVIRDLCERTQCKIDIDDEGGVTISGLRKDLVDLAVKHVIDIGAEPQVGMICEGLVTRILDFGALVQFMGSKEGMVHISEISKDRIAQVSDVLNVGDKVRVKVLSVEDNGRVRLSIKKTLP